LSLAGVAGVIRPSAEIHSGQLGSQSLAVERTMAIRIGWWSGLAMTVSAALAVGQKASA
jgi:hypothetical protein